MGGSPGTRRGDIHLLDDVDAENLSSVQALRHDRTR